MGNPALVLDGEHFAHVDYDRPLADLITACGVKYLDEEFDPVNFPRRKSGKADLRMQLVPIPHLCRSNDAYDCIREMDLRPATVHELLAFTLRFPDIREQRRIVALGSVWHPPGQNGKVPVSRIYCTPYWPALMLEWYPKRWSRGYLFLAVER